MKILDLTFPSPEDNLACDDALLESAEEGLTGEVLRFWEPRSHFVVVGYSNKVALEVRREACKKQKVPILRRVSGGGTVLQGPGCLNYTLVLALKERPLSGIRTTNDFVMGKNCGALRELAGPEVGVKGLTDLALGNLKFSGNAQRRKKNFVLFHGTFLLDFDFTRIEDLLSMPSAEPDYRQNRAHTAFLTNLNLASGEIKKCLAGAWGASGEEKFSQNEKMKALVEERYSKEAWNFKF